MTVPRKICCAIDFADPSRAAMRDAAELARQVGAELTLLHVVREPSVVPSAADSAVEPEDLGRTATSEAEVAAEPWRAEASAILGRPVDVRVVTGEPHGRIARYAREQGYDLIVTGMNAHKGLKERTLGSVAERLVRDAPCPVLVERPIPVHGPGATRSRVA